MADLDLSAALSFDSSGAVSNADNLTTATDRYAKANERATTSTKSLETGSRSLASTQSDAMRTMTSEYAARNNVTAAIDNQTKAQQRSNAVMDQGAKSARAEQFAIRNIGQQFGDFGLQVAAGQSPIIAFQQQIGQLGYALGTLEKGPLASVGAFLVGPWGIALTVGAAILLPFIARLAESKSELEKNAEAMDKVKAGSSGLSEAQSSLGQVFDLVTGKLKNANAAFTQQNELLRLNIQLTALKLRAEGLKDTESSGKAFASAGNASLQSVFGFLATRQGTSGGDKAVLDERRLLVDDLRNGRITTQQALQRAGALPDVASAKVGKSDFLQAIVDNVGGKLKTQIADKIDKSLATNVLDPAFRNAGSGGGRGGGSGSSAKAKADTTTPREVELIERINEQFGEQPKLINQAADAGRKLDAVIADLEKRKPPGFEKIIADAQTAKDAIAEGLNKPLRDFVKSANDAYQVNALILDGEQDQADALKEIQRLEAIRGPLNERQRDAVLATVQGMREQQRALDDLRQRNAKYLESLGSIKGIVEDATQAFVRGDLGQIIKTPGKLLDAFQTLEGRKLFDKVFGGVFEDLQDQVNGVSPVKDAAAKMGTAVDSLTNGVRQSNNAITSMADSASKAVTALGSLSAAANDNSPTGGNGLIPTSVLDGLSVTDAVAAAHGSPLTGRFHPDQSSDIVITDGNKRDVFGDAIGKVGESIARIFTKPETAKNIGTAIGSVSGKVFAGAAQGSFISGIGKAVGINLNQTGAQIGGAVGGLLTSIKPIAAALGPIGAFVGPALSIIGGVVGTLFKPKSNGSAGINAANGTFSAGTGSGANSKYAAQAQGLAGEVANGLNTIAKQLGGGVGSTGGVTIGVNNGNFHVNAVGGQIGKKGSGDTNFNQDEAGAVAYALQQLVAKGAITGLDEAVKKALASTPDVDAALQEALKVQDLETLIGGVAGQINKLFKTEADTAKDRLRIATQYGLDVTAVEKINAEQRAKLVADTLKQSVGSLQDVLSDLATGDLFQGSASDKRKAILAKIADLTPKAQAGEDGAADQVAALYRELYGNTRDAFGTAGPEFAQDVADIKTGAQAIIQSEQDRIDAALEATKETTAAVNETNDLLAIQNAAIAALPAGIAANLAPYLNYNLALDTGRATSLAA